MNEINYIIGTLAILFIIERKAINILIVYIGLIISIAIKIPQEQYINYKRYKPTEITEREEEIRLTGIKIENLQDIDGEYYSYILILVQVSALSILFGFIIMLYPSITLSPINNQPRNMTISTPYTSTTLTRTNRVAIIIIAILVCVYIIHILGDIQYKNIYESIQLIYKNIYNILNIDTYIVVKEVGEIRGSIESIPLEEGRGRLIRKIGEGLYHDDKSILKLILLTIILLMAIVVLFYLI